MVNSKSAIFLSFYNWGKIKEMCSGMNNKGNLFQSLLALASDGTRAHTSVFASWKVMFRKISSEYNMLSLFRILC